MESLRQNPLMVPQDGAIVMSEANSGLPLKGDFERMARRRFQRGQLFEWGIDRKVWVGRWREDVIVDGKISRRQVKEIIGTRNDYPTRKLALRQLLNSGFPRSMIQVIEPGPRHCSASLRRSGRGWCSQNINPQPRQPCAARSNAT